MLHYLTYNISLFAHGETLPWIWREAGVCRTCQFQGLAELWWEQEWRSFVTFFSHGNVFIAWSDVANEVLDVFLLSFCHTLVCYHAITPLPSSHHSPLLPCIQLVSYTTHINVDLEHSVLSVSLFCTQCSCQKPYSKLYDFTFCQEQNTSNDNVTSKYNVIL